ncbi:MAG: hypothetical protein JZD40_04165 [Sulfolobus sp.]|nr:hypothetical protein [Sulfolobus sp.]
MEALFNEILSSVNAHLMKCTERSNLGSYHLAAAIEEFSKYIFLFTFNRCKHYMVDKYESPEDILKFINSLMKSMEKLDKDHRFKYLLFLTFYH